MHRTSLAASFALVLVFACDGGAGDDGGPTADAGPDASTPEDAQVRGDGGEDAQVDPGDVSLSGPAFVTLGTCVELVLETTTDVQVASSGQFELHEAADCAAERSAIVFGPGAHSVFVRPIVLETIVVEASALADDARADHSMRALPAPSSPAAGALVLYNRNVAGDLALAQAYRDARELSDTQLCEVRLPPGSFASPDELLGAAMDVVEGCLCPAIAESERPSPCGMSEIDTISRLSPFTHLVLMPGIPTRLTGTPWPLDDEEPPLGLYLSALLSGTPDPFSSPSGHAVPVAYPPTERPIRLAPLPPLVPHEAGLMAYGHLAAADAERTVALIERTLEAEAGGFVGNVVVGDIGAFPTPFEQSALDRFGTHDPSCFDYLTHEPFEFGAPESSWPWSRCRVGSTGSTAVGSVAGQYPGEPGSTAPFGMNVGLYASRDYRNNLQAGFEEFETMLAWRRSDTACVAECDDYASSTEQAACRARSDDYFGVLDTECVGMARGGLAYQRRSFIVDHVGFWPHGWAPMEGTHEKSVPRVIEGGGYVGGAFADDRFVRFGDPSAVSSPTCRTPAGNAVPCAERIAVNLTRRIRLSPPLPIGGGRSFTIRMRARNTRSAGGRVNVSLQFNASSAGGGSQWFDTTAPRTAWTPWAVTGVPSGTGSVSQIDIQIRTFFQYGTASSGHVDLDAIEVVDDTSGLSLVPTDVGSFAAARHRQNVPGDLAANVIDRLGGVAAWGSSSHFYTGGHAYSDAESVVRSFFGGRTLGEAVLTGGSLRSGILFGDPLYRPVGARLAPVDVDGEWRGGTSSVPIPPEALGHVSVTAFAGDTQGTRWHIELCDGHDLEACEGSYETLVSGVGAIEATDIDLSAASAPEARVLRLVVSRDGVPPVYDHLYIGP